MIDELTRVIISLGVGVAGGFLSSWMGWNASGEIFNSRKHGNALIVGAVTGLAAGAAAAVIEPNIAPAAFALQLVGIFVGVIGIDRIRTDTSQSAANRAMVVGNKGKEMPGEKDN